MPEPRAEGCRGGRPETGPVALVPGVALAPGDPAGDTLLAPGDTPVDGAGAPPRRSRGTAGVGLAGEGARLLCGPGSVGPAPPRPAPDRRRRWGRPSRRPATEPALSMLRVSVRCAGAQADSCMPISRLSCGGSRQCRRSVCVWECWRPSKIMRLGRSLG